jgi:hypothetical protein
MVGQPGIYQDYEQERAASPDYQAGSPMCNEVAWDDPLFTAPDAPGWRPGPGHGICECAMRCLAT